MAKKGMKAAGQEKGSAFEEVAKKFKQNPGIYIGSVVILVLVIVTFLGGDLLSARTGGAAADFTFGEYDGAPISWVPGNMFSQMYEQIDRFYRSQGYDGSDFRMNAQIWRTAFEQTVVHTAILQLVRSSNYAVPEKTVDRAVARLPQFQSNGRFSPALYNQMPEASLHAIWKQTQEDLTKRMFFNDFFGLSVSSGEARFVSRMTAPMRSFDMVSFKVDDYPDEEYLVAANETPELFNSIHMSKITVTSGEREARSILASIQDGTLTFEDAARNHSQDVYADRGGDMGVRYLHELNNEITDSAQQETIYNLKASELSDVININDEWVIFRIEEELALADFDDSAVMDRVRSYIRNFARGRMEDWAIEKAKEFISEAAQSGFDNAASRGLKEKRSFGPLPVNYGSVELFPALDSFDTGLSSQEMQDMARNEDFWKLAFSTELNTPSEPFVHGDNVFVFLPTEEIESDEEDIETIAARYTDSWVSNVTDQSLRQFFLDSDKMDDRFWDAYFRYVSP